MVAAGLTYESDLIFFSFVLFFFHLEFYRSWNLANGATKRLEILQLVRREFGNCIIQGIFRKLKKYVRIYMCVCVFGRDLVLRSLSNFIVRGIWWVTSTSLKFAGWFLGNLGIV